MDFYIAFDKNSNTEFLLYRDMIHRDKTDETDEIYYFEPVFKCKVIPIGTFLLNLIYNSYLLLYSSFSLKNLLFLIYLQLSHLKYWKNNC